MQFHRISAVFWRYLSSSTFEFLRLVDIFYWPIFDIVLWGFTGLWLQNVGSATNVPLILLTGLVFWQVVMRAHMEVSMSFLEELWSQNLINLFATPLSISEWLAAVILLSFVKSLFALFFGALVVWLLYGIFIFSSGLLLIPFFVLLLISGWSLGLIGISILVSAGQRAQSLVWIVCWVLAPFSGVFYPVAVLPVWAQNVAYALPTTYLFEGMRLFITTGSMPVEYWYTSSILAAAYFLLSLLLFLYLFRKSKIQGLARLQID